VAFGAKKKKGKKLGAGRVRVGSRGGAVLCEGGGYCVNRGGGGWGGIMGGCAWGGGRVCSGCTPSVVKWGPGGTCLQRGREGMRVGCAVGGWAIGGGGGGGGVGGGLEGGAIGNLFFFYIGVI
jgi:hypothetical protein